MTIKLKPRPVATGSRLRDNNQAGKLINAQHTPPAALPQAAHVRARCFDRPAPVSAAVAWRRLRRYIPDEPARPRYAEIEKMCAELPYGYWCDAGGRLIIFNRRYRPLWQRLADGEIRRADPGEWVKWVEQKWFNWGDARYAKGARERLRKILLDFFAGEDLAARTIKTEQDLSDGPQRRKAGRS